jgi:hypothetical protein
MGGGIAEAVECLLCKCEALSSNSGPTKKKLKRPHILIGIALGLWVNIESNTFTTFYNRDPVFPFSYVFFYAFQEYFRVLSFLLYATHTFLFS